MTPSEQDNQNHSKDEVATSTPETPSESGAETKPEESPRDQSPSGQEVPEPGPLPAPQAGGAGENLPSTASPPGQDTDFGSNPRKILQELEKEYNSEKEPPPGQPPAVSPGAPPSPDGPSGLADPSLMDAAADDLITEAMRELDGLIKKIRESH